MIATWGALSAFSMPVSSFKTVPSGEQSLKFSKDPVLNKLQAFLEQGDLIRFYETVQPFIDQHRVDPEAEHLAGERLDRQLLFDRSAAMAPLFELNEDIPLHEAYIMKMDINLKEGVMNDLYVISRTNLQQAARPLARKKETAQLCALYAAMVVRMMHDYYCPDIEKKNLEVQKKKEAIWREAFNAKWGKYRREREEYNRNWKQPQSEEDVAKNREMAEKENIYMKEVRAEWDKRRELGNTLAVMEQRNSSIKSFLNYWADTFVGILLINYPEKASEVFKYLKLAGYKEDEMMKVVDQLEGRNKKTEFLYKSTLGKKFLKDRKEQEKSSTGD